MPGSRLSAAISRFCSTDHRRRLSPRVITSIRSLRALIRSVVAALSAPVSGSAGVSSIAMDNTHHTITAPRNVGSTLRLPLKEAMKLFWEHGFEGTSTDDLEAALKMGPSS